MAERTVWRRLSRPRHPRPRFALSPTDIAAFSDFGGNAAAVHRARQAAIAGPRRSAGVSIDPELLEGQVTGAPADLRAEFSASLLNLGPVGPIEPIDLAHLDVREEGRPW